MDKPYSSISRLVKAERRRRHLTLREFAAALSLESGPQWSHQSVKNWEDGKWLPDYYKMLRVAEMFHDWRGDLAIAIVKELRPEVFEAEGSANASSHST